MVHVVPLNVDVGKLNKLKSKYIILEVDLLLFVSGVKL